MFLIVMLMALISIILMILQQRPELLNEENRKLLVIAACVALALGLFFALRERIAFSVMKKELNAPEVLNVLGIEWLRLNNDYVIVKGSKLIGHAYISVTNVPYFIDDIEKEKKLWFTQNFARVLQTISFPFEIIVKGFPISTEAELKRIQREIDDLRMRLYVEKGMENPGAQAKLKRLEREQQRLLSGEGMRAVSFLIHLLVQGENEEKISNELNANAKTVSITLESTLGVKTKRLSGMEMVKAMKEFFRASGVALPSKIWKAFTWDLSYIIPFTQPKLPSIDQLTRGVYLGKTTGNIPVGIDLATQNNPHLCIIGITGSGKSVTCKTLAARYHDKYGSNILVIDYAGEYSPWVLSRGGVVMDMSKNTINPFELGGESLLVKIQQVVEAFEVICNFNLLQTNVFDKYVEKAYELNGFRLHDESTWGNKAPSLAQIIQLMEGDVPSLPAPEQASVESVLRRLRPLAQGPFGIFKASPISLADLTKGFVCLDLSKLASNSLKDLIAWSVFQYIDSVMRLKGQHEGIELLIIIEEAHRICKDPRAIPVRIIKEGRKYGYAVIVVAQDLSDLAPQIIANVGTMIVHQITHPQYLRFLEKQLGLAQHEVERLRNLERGEALVKLSTDAKPFFVRVDMERVEEQTVEKEILYEEIAEKKPEIKSSGKVRAHSSCDNLPLALSDDAEKLLEAIVSEEGLITTEYYRRLGLNSYRGNKAKAELEKLGLIEAKELPKITGKGRFGKVLKLTDKAKAMYGVKETKRFGGELHKHIVNLLSSKLRGAGLSVEVEAPLGSGALADILVNRKIAFEVETRGFREENVVKSLNAGMEKVVIVCQTEKAVEKIREKISNKPFSSKVVVVKFSSFLKNLDFYLHELGLKEVEKIELCSRNR
ncbi:MAG: DUF87 domain-containing protein [Candidatus Bathyarchaeia archaeon]